MSVGRAVILPSIRVYPRFSVACLGIGRRLSSPIYSETTAYNVIHISFPIFGSAIDNFVSDRKISLCGYSADCAGEVTF